MYIAEVIRRARTYCPSEFDTDEMYSWCDEVSAMLAVEDRNVFSKITLTPDKDGCVLLPDGVRFEYIVSAVTDGRVLTKQDLRHITGRRVDIKTTAPVEFICLVPYSPIRRVMYSGALRFSRDRVYLESCAFVPGDCVRINSDTETAVLDVGLDDDGYYIEVTPSSLDSLSDGDGTIERIVTEKTVCDAPYDGMYIDYILAKIGMYQRDYKTYNQFITAFNSRLDAYKRYLVNAMPQAHRRFVNWW